jgi:thiamine-phosphate diphosphorylase
MEGLYAILDQSLVSGDDWIIAANSLLRGGAGILQLRVKSLQASKMLGIARSIAAICNQAGALFVVNDRADVAKASNAALHVGQDDLPIEAARSFMGKSAVIGVSTHSLKQAQHAQRSGANYIAFGPIFPTATKHDALSPRGIEELKQIVKSVTIPVVAIGGIAHDNIAEIRRSGASSAAVISALGADGTLEKNARQLIKTWEEAGK